MNTKKKRWIKNINPSHLFLWGYEYAKLYKELDEGKGKLKPQKTIAERVKLIPVKRKAKKNQMIQQKKGLVSPIPSLVADEEEKFVQIQAIALP